LSVVDGLPAGQSGSLGVSDLSGTVDFVLACAVVHEMPSSAVFFREAATALKPGGTLLLVEPAGHVNPARFAKEIDVARQAGLERKERAVVRHCLAAVLSRKAA
jgi:SAM-dependent methyltransferase